MISPPSLSSTMKAPLFQWIQQQTGLHITSVNEGPVLLALQVLATESRMPTEQYAGALITNQINSQPFFDQITTHESFFLRHRRNMEAAIKLVIRPLLQKGIRPRVLSAPCAQGEEPYSFAILLQENGINPAQVEIIGVDIAESSIQQAKSGIYRNYALRQAPKQFTQHHFQQQGDTYQVHANIQQAVQFMRLNLLNDTGSRLLPGFDVIFSHNMLIYFDRATNIRMVKIFKQLMSDEGVLFVDSVEVSQPVDILHGTMEQGCRIFRKSPPPAAPLQKIRPQQSAQRPTRSTIQKRAEEPTCPSIEKRRNAKSAYQRKQFSEALNLYNQLIQQHPIWACWARIGKSKVLLDSGQDMEALEEAESALYNRKMDAGIYLTREDEADAHAIIALVLHRKGLLESRQTHLNQVRTLNPKHEILRLLAQ